MNKQGENGIEWTEYTWNPEGGCEHGCRWEMPDGSTAICYAEAVATGLARGAYPHGFRAHYWRPDLLEEPLKLATPSRIFLDSMSDLMGAWVPDEQIRAVLDVARQANWHTFQLLTKNAPRLLKFKDELPPNLWVGVSVPPTFMFGKRLSLHQQEAMLARAIDVLWQLPSLIRWISFEPLSFDVIPAFAKRRFIEGDGGSEYWPIEWAVIGAASKGKTYYQPKQDTVMRLLGMLDWQKIPVFFKGNLEWSPRRAEFPQVKTIQGRLL